VKLFADLYLDEDVDVVTANLLRHRGVNVVTARDEAMLRRSDVDQLHHAAAHGRCLVTHNRNDFVELYTQFVVEGREHAGIIIARRRPVYEVARHIAVLLENLTADEIANGLFYV
jgi:hypothetical protein